MAVKNFVTGVRLVPQSSFPTNPKAGTICYIDGTGATPEGEYVYDGSSWSKKGSVHQSVKEQIVDNSATSHQIADDVTYVEVKVGPGDTVGVVLPNNSSNTLKTGQKLTIKNIGIKNSSGIYESGTVRIEMADAAGDITQFPYFHFNTDLQSFELEVDAVLELVKAEGSFTLGSSPPRVFPKWEMVSNVSPDTDIDDKTIKPGKLSSEGIEADKVLITDGTGGFKIGDAPSGGGTPSPGPAPDTPSSVTGLKLTECEITIPAARDNNDVDNLTQTAFVLDPDIPDDEHEYAVRGTGNTLFSYIQNFRRKGQGGFVVRVTEKRAGATPVDGIYPFGGGLTYRFRIQTTDPASRRGEAVIEIQDKTDTGVASENPYFRINPVIKQINARFDRATTFKVEIFEEQSKGSKGVVGRLEDLEDVEADTLRSAGDVIAVSSDRTKTEYVSKSDLLDAEDVDLATTFTGNLAGTTNVKQALAKFDAFTGPRTGPGAGSNRGDLWARSSSIFGNANKGEKVFTSWSTTTAGDAVNLSPSSSAGAHVLAMPGDQPTGHTAGFWLVLKQRAFGSTNLIDAALFNWGQAVDETGREGSLGFNNTIKFQVKYYSESTGTLDHLEIYAPTYSGITGETWIELYEYKTSAGALKPTASDTSITKFDGTGNIKASSANVQAALKDLNNLIVGNSSFEGVTGNLTKKVPASGNISLTTSDFAKKEIVIDITATSIFNPNRVFLQNTAAFTSLKVGQQLIIWAKLTATGSNNATLSFLKRTSDAYKVQIRAAGTGSLVAASGSTDVTLLRAEGRNDKYQQAVFTLIKTATDTLTVYEGLLTNGPKGDQGDPGTKGDKGDVGPAGPRGPEGLAKYTYGDLFDKLSTSVSLRTVTNTSSTIDLTQNILAGRILPIKVAKTNNSAGLAVAAIRLSNVGKVGDKFFVVSKLDVVGSSGQSALLQVGANSQTEFFNYTPEGFSTTVGGSPTIATVSTNSNRREEEAYAEFTFTKIKNAVIADDGTVTTKAQWTVRPGIWDSTLLDNAPIRIPTEDTISTTVSGLAGKNVLEITAERFESWKNKTIYLDANGPIDVYIHTSGFPRYLPTAKNDGEFIEIVTAESVNLRGIFSRRSTTNDLSNQAVKDSKHFKIVADQRNQDEISIFTTGFKTFNGRDIQDQSIPARKLTPNSISDVYLAPGSVDTSKIRDRAVTLDKLASRVISIQRTKIDLDQASSSLATKDFLVPESGGRATSRNGVELTNVYELTKADFNNVEVLNNVILLDGVTSGTVNLVLPYEYLVSTDGGNSDLPTKLTIINRSAKIVNVYAQGEVFPSRSIRANFGLNRVKEVVGNTAHPMLYSVNNENLKRSNLPLNLDTPFRLTKGKFVDLEYLEKYTDSTVNVQGNVFEATGSNADVLLWLVKGAN